MDLQEFLNEWHNDSPTVLVHTSGSTGTPKPMWVEKHRMEASARMTCDFLGLRKGDTALLCMSLDYIAGKMMVVRALTCGLRLITVSPSGHPLSDTPDTGGQSRDTGGQSLCNPLRSSREGQSPFIDFAAMVPLQVWNSLHQPEERQRLTDIRHLIIGGGPVDAALADELAGFPHAVWSTYGMTETLSHIALRRLNGPERTEWYTPLPGVRLSQTEDGCLVINAPALHDGPLVTNDIVAFRDSASSLRTEGTEERPFLFKVLGRKDNVICSGGIKIQAEQVEKALAAHMHVPYIITKAPDRKLGEQVVLLTESADVESLKDLCRRVLPKYWQPRHVITVSRLPMTATGKPARSEAQRLAAAAVQPSR